MAAASEQLQQVVVARGQDMPVDWVASAGQRIDVGMPPEPFVLCRKPKRGDERGPRGSATIDNRHVRHPVPPPGVVGKPES